MLQAEITFQKTTTINTHGNSSFICLILISMKTILTLSLIAVLSLISCKKNYPIPVEVKPPTVDRSFSNVVILGNSITRASEEPSIGWNNNWGMAATKPEFDYYHLLIADFKLKNAKVKVNSIPTGEFEIGYVDFDLKYFAKMKALKPDLLIMRFGENTRQDDPNLRHFEAKYAALVNYFKDDNPNIKILAVGSFWGNPVVDAAMAKYSKFVTLTPPLNDISNQAFGQFENYNVAIHPSDKGMKAIEEIIWEGLKNL